LARELGHDKINAGESAIAGRPASYFYGKALAVDNAVPDARRARPYQSPCVDYPFDQERRSSTPLPAADAVLAVCWLTW
jgi:hypothetical protein